MLLYSLLEPATHKSTKKKLLRKFLERKVHRKIYFLEKLQVVWSSCMIAAKLIVGFLLFAEISEMLRIFIFPPIHWLKESDYSSVDRSVQLKFA